MKFLLVPCLLALAGPIAFAAEDGAPGQDFLRLANQWMTSPEASKRQAAYRSWMQLGPESQPYYKSSLQAAEKHHSRRLDELARSRGSISNPYAAHHDLARELDGERERVMKLILTDFEKDPSKIKMLRGEVDKMDRLWNRVRRAAAADTAAFDGALESAAVALAEIGDELQRFSDDPDHFGGTDESERIRRVLENSVEGSHVITQRRRFQQTRAELAGHEEAAKIHAGLGRWAGGTMKDFATLLNKERAILGLQALVLEEKLSDACKGHSADMARLGFFAHESPVKDKRTPWDRAKLAGFAGRGSGENIYMGSASHTAAFGAWFGSDGHRFIMFGSGPNTLGVGIEGRHWTMMTGQMDRPQTTSPL
jgi:uncharacterized protein YkwD